MSNTDLISRVFPLPGAYFDAIQRMIQRHPLCKAPTKTPGPPKTPKPRTGRETTEPPDPFDPDRFHSLELRFSRVPKTSAGLVFGVSEDCDVVLPQAGGISRRHFTLTYKNTFSDNCQRLILRDLNSKGGTEVSYDGQGKGQKKSHFDWILTGFEHPKGVEKVIVELIEGYCFQIDIYHDHVLTLPPYPAYVNQFLHGTASTADIFANVELNARGDETQALTPNGGRIILTGDTIASGSYGTVTRKWDVSTGMEYACKEPIYNNKYHPINWEREIAIMKELQHDNIVKICFEELNPAPKIYLEFMPFGDLSHAHRAQKFTNYESLKVLTQCLSALVYLHDVKTAVHRDIKPQNILVKFRDTRRANLRDPNALHVQVSDFGLSKKGVQWDTRCGTDLYMAPEVTGNNLYSPAVDIWSLGVVIMELVFGLPKKREPRQPISQADIIEHMARFYDDYSKGPGPNLSIVCGMLKWDGNLRPSASLCLEVATLSDIEFAARIAGVPPRAEIAARQQRGEHVVPVPAPRNPAPAPRNPVRHHRRSPHYIAQDVGTLRVGYRLEHVDDGKLVEKGVNILHVSRARLPVPVPDSTMREYVNQHIPVSDRDQYRYGADGGEMIRGTYLKFPDALKVCEHFNNKEGKDIIQRLEKLGAISYYTERSYQHGSYLCPPNESYMQLLG